MRKARIGIAALAGAAIYAVVTQIAPALIHPEEIADRLLTNDPIAVTVVAESADFALAAAAPVTAPTGHLAKLPPVSTAAIGGSHVLLYLRGQRNESVVITNINIRVLRRGQKLLGLLEPTGGAGGAEKIVKLRVWVDDRAPVVVEDRAPATVSNLEPYFLNNSISLKYGEKTGISIAAGATRDYCEWDIRIYYLVGDKPGFLIVNSTGVLRTETEVDRYPFRITGPAPLGAYQQVWMPVAGDGWRQAQPDALCTDQLPASNRPPSRDQPNCK